LIYRAFMLLVGLALFPLIHVLGNNPVWTLLQPAAFWVVALVPLGSGIAYYWADCRALGQSIAIPHKRSIEVLCAVRRFVLAASVMGAVLAVIHLLSYLSSSPSSLVAGLVVSLIVVFYGVLASELVLAPMIRQEMIRAMEPAAPMKPARTGQPFLIWVVTLVLSVVLVGLVWVLEEGSASFLTQSVALIGLLPAPILFVAWHAPASLPEVLWSGETAGVSDPTIRSYAELLESFRGLLYGSAALCQLLLFMDALATTVRTLEPPYFSGSEVASTLLPWVFALTLGELVLSSRRNAIQTELGVRGMGGPELESLGKDSRFALVFCLLCVGAAFCASLWVLPLLAR